jgi:hypothetical protein
MTASKRSFASFSSAKEAAGPQADKSFLVLFFKKERAFCLPLLAGGQRA